MRFLLLFLALSTVHGGHPRDIRDTSSADVEDHAMVELRALEEDGIKYLEEMDILSSKESNKMVLAEWDFASNITDATQKRKLEVSVEYAKFQKKQWNKLIAYPWREFSDSNIRRRFKLSSVLGTAALPEEKFAKYEETVNEMESIYSKAKICSFHDPKKCDLALNPEITEILQTSRDEAELRHVFTEWRKATGEKMRKHYVDYVDLINEAAKLNNFTDAASMWVRSYEASNFKEQLFELWDQIKPLYLQLHAYVRRNLRTKYGEKVVSAKGPIPMHLLGHIHAQTWGSIADFMLPFPNRESTDVTPSMVKNNYTANKIFRMAEEFFTSLDLSPMPESFWEKSILEKPEDGREIQCHATAWDFYDAKDFRIKQCTRVTQQHLYTAHHEMGHVEYFIQYKDQPVVYRDGANPGFHEAVGDVISLSVSTPKHLRAVGLLEEKKESDATAEREADINHLFSAALDKVAFIPSALFMDLWRWDVFEGRTKIDDMNCHWWKIREQFQGLESPVGRTEEDFDPASKYHIVASVPYIRYFVSYVIQFQFHRSLCKAAGQLENGAPLHQCDIYRSKEAGRLLGDMLKLGSSKPWPEAMQMLTGQTRMDASALREYFAPLEEWLRAENERTGEHIGWDTSDKVCVQSRLELKHLKDMREKDASKTTEEQKVKDDLQTQKKVEQ